MIQSLFELTIEQVKDLSSLLSELVGVVQNDAVEDPRFDYLFHRWHPISKAVSRSIDFDGFLESGRVGKHLHILTLK